VNLRKKERNPLDRGKPRVLVLAPTQSNLGHAADARLNLNAWLTPLAANVASRAGVRVGPKGL
jgi:hypothetical protein